MSNPFFEAFDASLSEAESIMGESWKLNGAEWPAIAIEDLETSKQRMTGGRYSQATLEITVRLEIAQASGVTDQSLIEARGQALRVIGFGNDGDASIRLICGPPGIRTT